MHNIHGILYEAPEGYKPLECYPTACGPGHLGDILIPDNIFGVDLRPSCHIHDYSWRVAEPTKEDFNQSNLMFLRNMRNAVKHFQKSKNLLGISYMIAESYYDAVNSFLGWLHFLAIKGVKPM